MDKKFNEQSPAYHGVDNAKYSMRGDDGSVGKTVVKFPYIKSVSFEPTLEQQPIYANNQKILATVSDQGYTGSIGTTAQDRDFEKSLGQIMDVSNGLADVNLNSLKRFDYYYEYKEETKNGVLYTVKVWVLNCEATKASKNHQTDTNTNTIGEYSYPLTVYGDKIMDSEGKEVYTDENGNELTATRVISVPSDAGYKTFGDSVPIVKVISAPTTK